MANTIQSLKWSDVAVPAGFVSQYQRFLEALEEKKKQRRGMAPSLTMYTKEHVSDNAKSKTRLQHHQTALHCAMLRNQDSNKKVMTGGTYFMGKRCVIFYPCF